MDKVKVAGKRVFVGLSGGVDSAVTAALLQDAGAKVTGVFIKGWYPPGLPCTWAADRRDAMQVAARLQLPFRTLDASEEYRKGVIEYLLAEYEAGRTPNPDIMCNKEVKFGAFYEYAMREGADYVATGHYACVEGDELHRGSDGAKDQSYFLWALPKEVLSSVVFPLGNLRKDQVRELAKRYRLPVAEKKDSQGICFLGSVSVEDFLRSEFDTSPGEAVDAGGTGIGTHDGVLLHTIGARIPLKGAAPGPWYVIGKDVARNRLVVAKERNAGTRMERTLEQVNLLGTPQGELQAQYRYHGPLVEGVLKGDTFIPAEAFPEALAPGQSLVFYEGRRCLGGGIMR